MAEIKKYYLGLDMGTNSVGWAVVDPATNDIVKKKGKSLWGSRLFNEGNTAEDRRAHRCGRRRTRRTKERREWIKELIGPELVKQTGDTTFFERLDNSFYYNEDKASGIVKNSNKNKNKNDYIVFDGSEVNGKPYTDYDFRKEYKTIYHLRKDMMDHPEKKFDLRMLYLVINHMNSHRGHFLFEGDLDINKSSQKELECFFNNLNATLADYREDEQFEDDEEYFQGIDTFELDEEFFSKLEDIMKGNKGKNDKKSELKELFGVENKTFVNNVVIPLFVGSNVNVASLSLVKDQKLTKTYITFDSEDYESGFNEASNLIPVLADLFGIAMQGKIVYDYYYLKKVLKGQSSLSDAMVNRYELHAKQLKDLKRIANYMPSEIIEIDGKRINRRTLFYNAIFKYQIDDNEKIKLFNEIFTNQNKKIKSKELNNYRAYIGYNKEHNNTIRTKHLANDQEDFYNFLINSIIPELIALEASEVLSEDIREDIANTIVDINSNIENSTYLNRHNSKTNSAFPNQIVVNELRVILENQSKFYDFLSNSDKYGSISDKLIQILKFRLPYYVGPLKVEENIKDQNAWCIKNKDSDQKLYPWTLNEIVNVSATAKEFIQHMQNKCQYLNGENCLPKASILFSEYKCLQYINKLNVNGSPIEHDTKMKILNKFFKEEGISTTKYGSKTRKTLKEFIRNEEGENAKVTTSNNKDIEEINCDMKTYFFYKQLFGVDFDKNIDVIEDIIRDCTIFEDKKILEKRLKDEYNLNDEATKKIKAENYNGYGRISGKLLNGIEFEDIETGEVNTVIGFMREKNVNLQELLSSQYTLKDKIDEHNKNLLDEDHDKKDGEWLEYIDENIYTNPAIKTTLIQAYRIIEEVRRIIYPNVIDKFFIESTRAHDKKPKRTSSRYEKLSEMYGNAIKLVKDNIEFNANEIKKLKNELDKNKDNLQSDMYYLYFSQLGRDMYEPNKVINIEDVKNNTYLDIDHIYPQAIVKDDSLSNRVLTNKNFNSNKKGDRFLCEVSDFTKNFSYNKKFYELLEKSKLISKEKYRRLTQTENNIDDVIKKFENRQLVTTNQAIIGLRDLLVLFDGVERTKVIFTKGNNISEFRHKFDLPKSRIANNFHHAHDAYLNVVVGSPIHQYFNKLGIIKSRSDYNTFKSHGRTANPMRLLEKDREELNWNKKEMISKINYNLYERYDCFETTRQYVDNNMLKQVTIKPAGQGTAPVKTNCNKNNIERYGGFMSPKYQNFVLFEGKDKKGRTNTHIIAVSQFDKVDLAKSIKKTYPKYVDIKILIENLKINTVVKKGPHKFYLTGRHHEKDFCVQNARDIYWDKDSVKIFKKIEKYIDKKKNKSNMLENEDKVIIAVARNNNCDEIVLTRDELNSLYQNLMNKIDKPVYRYLINKTKDEIAQNLNYEMFETIDDCVKQIVSILECLHTNEQKSSNKIIDCNGEKTGITIGDFSNGSGLQKAGKSKDGTHYSLELVSESVTGYYTKTLFKSNDK